MKKKQLLLLPNLLGDYPNHEVFLPSSVDRAVKKIDGLIAESETGGRRYLGRFFTAEEARNIPIATMEENVDFLLEPITRGECWGLVSDAGLPCIADPGAKIVAKARSLGIQVQTFVGPSSIFLGLMLSGFSGQKFTFNGYLEKDPQGRQDNIQKLEKRAHVDQSTQIFIETPFRNMHLLETLLDTLSDTTLLCVAWDLTLPTQGVLSQPVSVWKKSPLPNLKKRAAIFLIGS